MDGFSSVAYTCKNALSSSRRSQAWCFAATLWSHLGSRQPQTIDLADIWISAGGTEESISRLLIDEGFLILSPLCSYGTLTRVLKDQTIWQVKDQIVRQIREALHEAHTTGSWVGASAAAGTRDDVT